MIIHTVRAAQSPVLETLRISNYALIESAYAELSPGFTAITGETGAGKSVLLGSLRTVLGERAGADLVRQGAKKATIEALFRGPFPRVVLAALEDGGFLPGDEDDGQLLILRREIQSAGGTTRNLINGRAATATQVREIAARLVDMHAQHENGRLFHPSEQLGLLDSFGDCEEAREAYRRAYKALCDARERLAEVRLLAQEGGRRVDYLKFQAEELRAAAIEPTEEDTLETERRRLAHADRLFQAASEAADLILEGETQTGSPASDLLRKVSRLTSEIVSMDPDQEILASDAEQLRYAVNDLGERLRDYAATVGGDPRRLQKVEDRIAELKGLKRKHQVESTDALVELLQSVEQELERIEHVDWELASDEKACQEAGTAAVGAARILSALRQEACQDFESLVEKEMADLELPGARLQVQLISRQPGTGSGKKTPGPETDLAESLGPDGAESVEFLVSLNPGSPPLPLRKVASGGEVARIMLAIKCVLATSDDVPTLVFDEIDVGISGQAAARVGEKLAALSRHHQLLCITHLPQVAARGVQHLLVEKQTVAGAAQTRVHALEPEARKMALATMLGGHTPNEEARRYAEKLLETGSLPEK